jgi:hypothetical protein
MMTAVGEFVAKSARRSLRMKMRRFDGATGQQLSWSGCFLLAQADIDHPA